jgi:hypothetical protein
LYWPSEAGTPQQTIGLEHLRRDGARFDPLVAGEQVQLQEEPAQRGEANRLVVLEENDVPVARVLDAAAFHHLGECFGEKEVRRRDRVPDLVRHLVDGVVGLRAHAPADHTPRSRRAH